MTGWLTAFPLSFGVIFVAELGDKSQLMALAFAGRYRVGPVLIGITLATVVVHAVSVAVGHGMGVAIPAGWVALSSGIVFLAFAAWSPRGDSLADSGLTRAARTGGSAVLAVSVAFLLAELGDKTMLATIALAADNSWVGVLLGSTLGMVAADAIAIAAGRALVRRLPERAVRYGAAALFVLFGGWLLVEGAARLTGTSPWAALVAVLNHHVAGWIALGLGLAVLAGIRWTTGDSGQAVVSGRARSGPGRRRAGVLLPRIGGRL